METTMFCFQCEQTAGKTACTTTGTCGKNAQTAGLQDLLTGALISYAMLVESQQRDAYAEDLMLHGLFATVTNVDFDDAVLAAQLDDVRFEAKHVLENNEDSLSSHADYQDFDMALIWDADEDLRSLKSLLLFGLRGMAAYAHHARVLGYSNQEVNDFLFAGMAALGKDLNTGELLPLVLKVGEQNLACMALLDKANTETYGSPEPTTVSLTIEKGPFIVISGHDLKDLELLLEQTAGRGINIYTHCEMLPAHAYPKLKSYPHLKGNFGTAWQNQQKEFAGLPAPILFTTNCLMPVKESYADRVFTTGVVAYPQMAHIGQDKDFAPLIAKALELGGYDSDVEGFGINGGKTLTTGFGRDAVLGVADMVIEAVKSGAIRHFFLVAGCDGAYPGRNYYTEFVENTPADSMILTLACGKYRFNDMDLGTIGGLPRILDMGQCNDAYSAIQVAVALANAFECEVNDLPLSMVLSWYEQKAVCILLTLLFLGIRNILLGPSLPAFISPNVLQILVDNYNIAAISTPQEDLKKLLA